MPLLHSVCSYMLFLMLVVYCVMWHVQIPTAYSWMCSMQSHVQNLLFVTADARTWRLMQVMRMPVYLFRSCEEDPLYVVSDVSVSMCRPKTTASKSSVQTALRLVCLLPWHAMHACVFLFSLFECNHVLCMHACMYVGGTCGQGHVSRLCRNLCCTAAACSWRHA